MPIQAAYASVLTLQLHAAYGANFPVAMPFIGLLKVNLKGRWKLYDALLYEDGSSSKQRELE